MRIRLGVLLVAACFAVQSGSVFGAFDTAIEDGTQLIEAENYAEAAELFDAAIKSFRKEKGGDTATLVELLLPATRAHAKLGHARQAKKYFKEAFRLLEKVPEQRRMALVTQAFEIRRAYYPNLNDYSAQMKHLESLHEMAVSLAGKDDLQPVDMATRIGVAHGRRGDQDKATKYLDRAYAYLNDVTNTDPDEAGRHALALAAAYIRVNRTEHVEKLVNWAVEIRTTTEEPVPIVRVAPVYPDRCLKYKVAGEVVLEFDVDEKGVVKNPKATEVRSWRGSSRKPWTDSDCREGMASAATTAVGNFRYIPRLENGTPVESKRLDTQISFWIED